MSVQPEERDDYLWNKSGTADAEVARLERLLGRYRYDAARDTGFDSGLAVRRARASWRVWAVSLAAGLAVLVGARAWWSHEHRPSYEVTGIAGLERAHVGDSIETNAGQIAIVRVATLGDVELQPGSRVRVDELGDELHKLFLDRGALSATILAKPGVFQIGTPAGLSIDLGCKYELSVDPDGTTHMRVLTGRVRFQILGKSVVVPAGAECEAKQGFGPNVPVRVAATEEFRSAARHLERADEWARDDVKMANFEDLQAQRTVLEDADAHDESVTLFHLFTNAKSEQVSSAALARLEVACPLPDGVTREMLLRREERAVDAWRDRIAERYWR